MDIGFRIILGEQIKEARKKKNMSQEELGEKLGYVKQSVSDWERGVREVPDDVLDNLNGILETKFSKKALKDLEDKKMRGSNIKSIDEVDRF